MLVNMKPPIIIGNKCSGCLSGLDVRVGHRNCGVRARSGSVRGDPGNTFSKPVMSHSSGINESTCK